jgi:hypothetical protein
MEVNSLLSPASTARGQSLNDENNDDSDDDDDDNNKYY